MFIGRVFVHPTSGMSGATASSPVCAVLGMLFFAAFITLAVIAIVACVMAAFDRDVDRLLHAAIVVAIMAFLLAVTWAWWADRRIRTYQMAFTLSAIFCM